MKMSFFFDAFFSFLLIDRAMTDEKYKELGAFILKVCR